MIIERYLEQSKPFRVFREIRGSFLVRNYGNYLSHRKA